MTENKKYNPNNFSALHAAVAFLLFWAMNLVLGEILLGLSKIPAVEKFLSDEYAEMCVSLVLMALGLFLIVWSMSKILKVNPVSGGGFLLRKSSAAEIVMTFVLFFGLCGLLLPVSETFSENWEIFRYQGLHLPRPAEPEVEGSAWVLLAILLIPVLPAIFEELLFRGVILRGLLQFGKVPAVLLSAFVFALAHGSYQQFIYQFIVGIMLGCLFVETKNIAVSMAGHFANNFFASWVLSIVYASAGTGPNAEVYIAIADIMFALIGTACVVSAFLYFGKRIVSRAKNGAEETDPNVVSTMSAYGENGEPITIETPWYQTVELTLPLQQRREFQTKKGMAKINKKASAAVAIVLLGLGIAFGLFTFVISIVVPY